MRFLPALIDRPMAGSRWQSAGGLFVRLIWALAVGGGVSNTWAAGRCGRTGGGLGFNLQPLVSQGLCKVVIDRDADRELLGAGFLVVHSEASLEVLLNHVVIVTFRNCCKRRHGWHQNHTPQWVSESEWMLGKGVTIWWCSSFTSVPDWPDEWPLWSSDLQEWFLDKEDTQVITEGRIWKAEQMTVSLKTYMIQRIGLRDLLNQAARLIPSQQNTSNRKQNNWETD